MVLWLGSSAQTSSTAIDAAMLLARAYDSEVESLFVEDQQLFELAGLPFARIISSGEEGWRALPSVDLEREIHFVGAALQRQIATTAREASVTYRSRVVRDDPMRALARACSETGPWNVVTIAEPFGAWKEDRLRDLFSSVHGTTGVVIAGPMARRIQGPIIAVVEEIERLSPMLKVADRINEATGGPVKLLLVGDRKDELAWLEGEARLLFSDGEETPFEVVLVERGDTPAVAETLRRHRAGFVLAQYGGLTVPAEGNLRPLSCALECPLLIVR
ncbi:MAG: hypothetical protein ABUJ93_10770 [Hyphomicrobium sp.]